MKVYLGNSLRLVHLLVRLIASPTFIAVTFLGNIIVIGFSLALYWSGIRAK